MDERKQPSIYKNHPELQKSIAFDGESNKKVNHYHPSFSNNELDTMLPKGVQTRQQITKEVEEYMQQRGKEQLNNPKSSSAERMFRPTNIPAYFKKTRPTLYEQVRKSREFYESVAESLMKSEDQYILFEEPTFTHEVPSIKNNDFHKKYHSISLQGIMDEEARSLNQQKSKNFSLFPEE